MLHRAGREHGETARSAIDESALSGLSSGSVTTVVGAVVLIVMAVLCGVAGRAVALWWARQPLGAVHRDGGVELRVGARQVDEQGRCGNSGELAVVDQRLVVTVGDRRVMSVPVGEVGASVRLLPRPVIWIFGDGWGRAVVVDRARPVPVLVGQIGLLRQTTTAQVVVGAIGQAIGDNPSSRDQPAIAMNAAAGDGAAVGDRGAAADHAWAAVEAPAPE